MSSIHIAVEGCCHGELDSIYSTVEFISREKGKAIELLLVCGDFECIRDNVDLACVAVPPKYRKLVGFDLCSIFSAHARFTDWVRRLRVRPKEGACAHCICRRQPRSE